jgi:hypothetical protein
MNRLIPSSRYTRAWVQAKESVFDKMAILSSTTTTIQNQDGAGDEDEENLHGSSKLLGLLFDFSFSVIQTIIPPCS